MTNEFKIKTDKCELSKRVRAVIGVPLEFLEDDVIFSPVFIKKTEAYINRRIKEYLETINVEDQMLDIASVYYIAYLLCSGMDARLPKQMDNISTKTILQSISWDKKAMEFLDQCGETIDQLLEEYNVEETFSLTFADISAEQSYPESNV